LLGISMTFGRDPYDPKTTLKLICFAGKVHKWDRLKSMGQTLACPSANGGMDRI